MRNKLARPVGATALALVAALVVAACGSTSPGGSTGAVSTGGNTPTITMLLGTAPQSLDPGLDYTTQGSEFNWQIYTGLTTYARASGTAGTKLIPGLAAAMPTITNGGRTYTVTLRKGLVFSNGKPVKASDFLYTVERTLKIPWGGASFFITPYIQGAAAYAAGSAKTISGIKTNDSTGQITINLTKPYGPFDNVLAFPSMGIIPAGTPMKPQPTNPPPGVGPYMVTTIVPQQSFSFVQNPEWAKMRIPGIPAGYVDVNVEVDSNILSNALSVLNNSADLFDWADTVPGSLLSQIKSKASDRFKMVNLGSSTYYIFMNVTRPPFNNQLVREAVVTGLNRNAMSRLGAGTLEPGCYFLPPAMPGHPTAPCPYGTPGNGDMAKAKQLIQQSGMAGTAVTVWSETRSPRKQWMTYYTQFLNSIGLRATQKVVDDANYWGTVGQSKTLDPQTGFADWNQDFPNPIDLYGPVLTGGAITATDNENLGQINDPYINQMAAKLGPKPLTPALAAQWQKVDEYTAKKAYLAVFGYQSSPFFTSDHILQSSNMTTPIYGWDLSQIQVKQTQ